MAKSHFEKQDIIISQFERICKQSAWEDKHGKTNLTATEQAILDGKKAKAKRALQPKQEEVRISFYNPNNPLNGSSSWSKQQWAEYKERNLKS